jgi:predicted transposase/invertase (TIGR01784 family)
MRYPSLLIDPVFKHFFSADLKVTSSFISAILFPDESNEIEVIEILSPEMISPFPEGKRTYLDLKAKDMEGAIYQIELQVTKEFNYIKRSFYYATNLVSQSLKIGDAYQETPPVVQINILDFSLFEDKNQVVSRFFLKDQKERILSQDFQMIYLELPKFDKVHVDDLDSKEELWLFLLKNITQLSEGDRMKVLNRLPNLENAFHILKHYESDPEKQRQVREQIMSDRNYAYELAAHYEDGEAKGIEKGLAKGELKKAIETARKMRIKGYSDPEISEITGLSDEEMKGI